MTTRDTGKTVTLPLVWRGDELWIGYWTIGELLQLNTEEWLSTARPAFAKILSTRSAAERAVEDAVIAALEGGGDE